jgi:hypothetical protein
MKFDVSKAKEDRTVILWISEVRLTSQSKFGKQLDLQFSQL